MVPSFAPPATGRFGLPIPNLGRFAPYLEDYPQASVSSQEVASPARLVSFQRQTDKGIAVSDAGEKHQGKQSTASTAPAVNGGASALNTKPDEASQPTRGRGGRGQRGPRNAKTRDQVASSYADQEQKIKGELDAVRTKLKELQDEKDSVVAKYTARIHLLSAKEDDKKTRLAHLQAKRALEAAEREGSDNPVFDSNNLVVNHEDSHLYIESLAPALPASTLSPSSMGPFEVFSGITPPALHPSSQLRRGRGIADVVVTDIEPVHTRKVNFVLTAQAYRATMVPMFVMFLFFIILGVNFEHHLYGDVQYLGKLYHIYNNTHRQYSEGTLVGYHFISGVICTMVYLAFYGTYGNVANAADRFKNFWGTYFGSGQVIFISAFVYATVSYTLPVGTVVFIYLLVSFYTLYNHLMVRTRLVLFKVGYGVVDTRAVPDFDSSVAQRPEHRFFFLSTSNRGGN